MSPPLPFKIRFARRLQLHWQNLMTTYVRLHLAGCGTNVVLGWPVVINGPEHVRLGDRVCINPFVHIWGQGGVEIGDDSLVASHVAITSLTHEPGAALHAQTSIAKPVKIGRNVWIGTHSVILPGVTIGDNAIIGAGAVVTRDVSPGERVVGMPARPLPPA